MIGQHFQSFNVGGNVVAFKLPDKIFQNSGMELYSFVGLRSQELNKSIMQSPRRKTQNLKHNQMFVRSMRILHDK